MAQKVASEPARQQIFPLVSGGFDGLSDKIWAFCHIGKACGSGCARFKGRQAAFFLLILII
jgi:hypothetical protein